MVMTHFLLENLWILDQFIDILEKSLVDPGGPEDVTPRVGGPSV